MRRSWITFHWNRCPRSGRRSDVAARRHASAETFDPALLDRLGVAFQRLETDSRQIRPGDVFVAMPGGRVDARALIPQAIAAGAVAVIWERDGFAWDPSWLLPNVSVQNLRTHLGTLASRAYGQPSRHLWVAGVTGTNGKTSCSHWIAQSLGRLGRRTGVIGTLGNGFPGRLATATHTTPDAVAVHAQLAQLLAEGAMGVAMEVSSHGLDQGRVNGVSFAAALFTNLSRDHLDYHGDMGRYGAAKARLFHWPELRHAVINLDDRFGAELAASLDRSRVDVLGYGFGRGEISGHHLDLSKRGLSLEIETPWGPAAIRSQLLGGFNAANLMGVLGILLAAGIELHAAAGVLEKVEPVVGRLQLVRRAGRPVVVVDYAHTPDALEKVLETLRGVLGPRGRLLCVFGCGGDRDPGKRPLMGEVATRLADHTIVTSDNPRSEQPLAIIDQVLVQAHPTYEVEADRAAAILKAIRGARPDDIVLIAGKGHETYQEIAGRRLPFSDADVASAALDEADRP
ncbi:MAG: UDP-N-acetylmuramoyl-L-alanyl-D-glutamate--2,6-diaminopimelate ligase [Proteobacteria bacterium]|nr:MAG: UDP-N-acetylmuramoyl-L-alanyl-D-glutamate--2,6-diaminopimelate ligase [Pseudomonadota bacterium]